MQRAGRCGTCRSWSSPVDAIDSRVLDELARLGARHCLERTFGAAIEGKVLQVDLTADTGDIDLVWRCY